MPQPEQSWLVSYGSTSIKRLPAHAALSRNIEMNLAHEASWTCLELSKRPLGSRHARFPIGTDPLFQGGVVELSLAFEDRFERAELTT